MRARICTREAKVCTGAVPATRNGPAATSTGTAPSRMSVPGGPLPLFGVSRDLSRADDVNEPRYRDEIDHRSNDHRKQPGGCYLPPSTHHSPLSVARGSEPVGALGRRKTGRSPRGRHYATSQFARNKKVILPDHVPVTTRSGALHLRPKRGNAGARAGSAGRHAALIRGGERRW